jgi:hypothetical protein
VSLVSLFFLLFHFSLLHPSHSSVDRLSSSPGTSSSSSSPSPACRPDVGLINQCGCKLTCQYRLHIRHGNLDRRRNLPNNLYPSRRSTFSRLGRFRMGRSIRVVLLYVPFLPFPLFPLFRASSISHDSHDRAMMTDDQYGELEIQCSKPTVIGSCQL